MQYPDFLLSSQGYGLAMRWRAVIVAILPGLIAILRGFGVNWLENDVIAVVDGLLWVAVLGMFAYGWIRALKNKKEKLGKFAPKD